MIGLRQRDHDGGCRTARLQLRDHDRKGTTVRRGERGQTVQGGMGKQDRVDA